MKQKDESKLKIIPVERMNHRQKEIMEKGDFGSPNPWGYDGMIIPKLVTRSNYGIPCEKCLKKVGIEINGKGEIINVIYEGESETYYRFIQKIPVRERDISDLEDVITKFHIRTRLEEAINSLIAVECRRERTEREDDYDTVKQAIRRTQAETKSVEVLEKIKLVGELIATIEKSGDLSASKEDTRKVLKQAIALLERVKSLSIEDKKG